MKYFVVLLVLGALNSATSSPLGNGQCPKYCDCKETNSNEEIISCKKGASSLTIKVAAVTYVSSSLFESDESGNELVINCTTFDQFAYGIAPQFNVSELIGLVYNKCPLPDDGSLSLGFSDLYGIRFTADQSSEYGTWHSNHFDGLDSLNELRLYSKMAFNLDDNAFNGLSRLRKLYLHSKQINFAVFNSLTNVEKIEIGLVNGEFNLDGFRNCEKLEQINLANLQLSRLSKRIFENLPLSVETIFFYDNEINTIDPDVFESVDKLWFVRFSGNDIQNLPSHFRIPSKKFQYFQLMGDHESLPDELFSNLPTLRDVDIKCNLKSVPENLFKGSYNLNIVNLTGNRLTDLPENFLANQTKLFHLYLDQNRFDVLPENLITNLMTKPTWVSSVLFIFSFKSNRIRSISESDWKLLLRQDAEYDFSDNLFADFSVFNNLGEKFTNSKSYFIFDDNPIVCDCEKIKGFRKYLKNEQHIFRYRFNENGSKCASPANLNGTAVVDVRCDGVE